MSDASAATTSLMLRETAEAPDVVARLLDANAAACAVLGDRLRRKPPAFAVTCARGSSDSAATYAKYLIEICLGPVVASVGPSVSSIYGRRPKMRGALFVAISQSGRSPDLLTLAEAARDDDALTVAIVNDTTSPLAGLCEVVLPLHAGAEKSVAATKSYIASLAAVLQLVALWSGDPALDRAVRRLPDDLDDALAPELAPRRCAARCGAEPLRRRPRAWLWRGAGGRAKTQGDRRPSRRGAELRRTSPRSTGARRSGLPGPSVQPERRGAPWHLLNSASELAGRGVPVITGRPGVRFRRSRPSDCVGGRPLRPADRAGPELLPARRGRRPRPWP